MSDLLFQHFQLDGVFAKSLAAFIMLTLRYFIVAGIAFLMYYVWRSNSKLLFKKIQTRFAKVADFKREILYSLSTFVIFAAMVGLIKGTFIGEYSKVYTDFSEHSIGYFIFTVVLMIFIHDTYFYWSHRLMHHPKIYPLFHKVHHLSTNPSPWASFSFHPLEAVVEFSVIFLNLFIFPVHPIAILIFSTFMVVENVMGHLGYEFLPKNWNKYWFTKWINTSTNHNMHHQYFKGNYGLYFTIWDRLMGTLHPKYEERFEEVAGQKLVEEEAETYAQA